VVIVTIVLRGEFVRQTGKIWRRVSCRECMCVSYRGNYIIEKRTNNGRCRDAEASARARTTVTNRLTMKPTTEEGYVVPDRHRDTIDTKAR